MLKQRRKAVEQVTDHLHSAEAAIDAALNKTAVLAAAIPTALVEANLSHLYCQEALERVAEAIAAIAQARRGIVETHKELAVVKGQIGLGAVAFGDSGPKPPVVSPTATRILQPVEDGAVAA
jgi:hypothetical protein